MAGPLSNAVGSARLAIVVPAWKPEFLAATLASIAAQDCAQFDCHIFDDAGPDQVRRIAAQFPRFSYHRFADNMGGQSLVAHWNRCLVRLNDEWVWLFSDDDVMAPGSVQAVLAAIAAHPDVAVLQLPVQMVDASLRQVLWASEPPAHESALSFLKARLRGERLSCLPDHVFNWHKLRALAGGLVNLPLAWGADDATWLLLGAQGGLAAAPGAQVLWRQSGSNISGDQRLRWRKLEADLQFIAQVQRQNLVDAECRRLLQRWLARRLVDVYGFGWADAQGLWRALPGRWQLALLRALLRLAWHGVKQPFQATQQGAGRP